MRKISLAHVMSYFSCLYHIHSPILLVPWGKRQWLFNFASLAPGTGQMWWNVQTEPKFQVVCQRGRYARWDESGRGSSGIRYQTQCWEGGYSGAVSPGWLHTGPSNSAHLDALQRSLPRVTTAYSIWEEAKYRGRTKWAKLVD